MSQDSLLNSLIHNLQEEGLLKAAPRTHLVLAYSGGADSTALLGLLTELKSRFPLDVTAAYFNHGWRDNPPAELPLVHQNCMTAGVPLVIVPADKTTPQTERAAREARYMQLTGLAYDLHADALLTAHHADDQIETILFRMIRGTGVDGLIGIQHRLVLKPSAGKPVPILRPMLDSSRNEIRAYIQEKGLKYFDDPTNENTKHHRNLIRHNLLPVLQEAFPQVRSSLFRLSQVAEGDAHIIEEAIAPIWGRLHGKDDHGFYLDAVRFNQLGLPYQRRLIKRFLNEQGIFPDFQNIEETLAFIRGESRRNLSSALKSMMNTEDGKPRFLSLYKDRLRLLEPPKEAAKVDAVPVTLDGETVLDGLSATLKSTPWQAGVSFTPIRPGDPHQVFVNLSAYADKPLELRTRRAGDKFQPMGMDMPLRFKKFLINRAVPRFDRNRLPVLAHGDKILWAPGLGLSQELVVKPEDQPTHLFKLEYDGSKEPVPSFAMVGLPAFGEEASSAESASPEPETPKANVPEPIHYGSEYIQLSDDDEEDSDD